MQDWFQKKFSIAIVAGARQVGKTTLVQQITESIDLPVHFASANKPTLRGADWIAQQWEIARMSVGKSGRSWFSTRCRKRQMV